MSIGLAANRLMAKIAAGRDKPRGFTVIDAEDAPLLLAPEPVRLLPVPFRRSSKGRFSLMWLVSPAIWMSIASCMR